FAVYFVTTDLFVECVEKLLTGRSSSECGAVMFSAAEAAKVEQSFRGAREGNTHAIEEIDDRRRHFAHRFRGWLVRQKVAAVNSVIEMFPRRIAFAFSVDGSIDSALRADRMRALHGHDGKQIDSMAGLRDFHGG